MTSTASLAPGLGLTEGQVLGVLGVTFDGMTYDELAPVGGLRHVRAESEARSLSVDLYGPSAELQRIELTATDLAPGASTATARRSIAAFLGLYAPDAVDALLAAFDRATASRSDEIVEATSLHVHARLEVQIAEAVVIVVLTRAG